MPLIVGAVQELIIATNVANVTAITQSCGQNVTHEHLDPFRQVLGYELLANQQGQSFPNILNDDAREKPSVQSAVLWCMYLVCYWSRKHSRITLHRWKGLPRSLPFDLTLKSTLNGAYMQLTWIQQKREGGYNCMMTWVAVQDPHTRTHTGILILVVDLSVGSVGGHRTWHKGTKGQNN